MTQSFKEHLAADRRLVVLRLLADSTGYQANVYIVEAALNDMGHATSSDQVKGDLAWLDEQALLTRSDVAGVTIARITRRGLDVARGNATVPGVKRPEPV